MRPSARAILGAVALAFAFAFSGCQNPLDPIDKSDKIQGLTWVEINDAAWEQWDSDPEADGMIISLAYKNEFGDELEFHDKGHDVAIEFWTQKDIGDTGSPYLTRDQLFFSKTVRYEHSDDDIRIPVEAYFAQLSGAFDLSDPTVAAEGMLVVRVFPPQEYPRPELLVALDSVLFYEAPLGDDLTP